jgi:hypothetical protein
VFVNANGNITFGGPDDNFLNYEESTLDHLVGPPRVAGLWDDLNPTTGGVVTYSETSTSFTVHWNAVPEWPATGANTFSVSFTKKSRLFDRLGALLGNSFTITYGALSAGDGLAGYSCGGALTSGFEEETDLSKLRKSIGGLIPWPAIFEDFVGTSATETVDLAGSTRKFNGVNRIIDLIDAIRSNDKVTRATPVFLPFDSANPAFATVIEPLGDDVDFYKFNVEAGDTIALEVVRGNLDTVIGVFDATTGELLFVDDDGGDGLLSRLLLQTDSDMTLAVAVSTYPDFDFTGQGGSAGRYTLYVNTYQGEIIDIGDDDTVEVDLGGFAFDFQGETHTSLFVNSNGSLSFGAGDVDRTPSVPEFLAGAPRISPLWIDLDPTGFFGIFGNPGLVLVDTRSKSAEVHFVSVGEFFVETPNYFTVKLGKRGEFDMRWGPTARGGALVGVTEGNGAVDPGPTDLSRGDQSATGTTYELMFFNLISKGVSSFDLFFDEVEFE